LDILASVVTIMITFGAYEPEKRDEDGYIARFTGKKLKGAHGLVQIRR